MNKFQEFCLKAGVIFACLFAFVAWEAYTLETATGLNGVTNWWMFAALNVLTAIVCGIFYGIFGVIKAIADHNTNEEKGTP